MVEKFWKVCLKLHNNVVFHYAVSKNTWSAIHQRFVTIFLIALQLSQKRNKRKPKKKTKGAPKFRHQGWHWIDQRLSLHVGLARHGPQGEDEVFRLEVWRGTSPKKAVLFVMARFQTPSEINDFLQLCYCQFFKNHSKRPAKVVRGILVKWSIYPPGVIFRFLLWKTFIVFSKNLRKKMSAHLENTRRLVSSKLSKKSKIFQNSGEKRDISSEYVREYTMKHDLARSFQIYDFRGDKISINIWVGFRPAKYFFEIFSPQLKS